MTSFFAPGGHASEPWFRLGRLEVTTVVLFMIAVVVSWLAWVLDPSMVYWLAFMPEAVVTGQVWRVLSWPFAGGLSLWGVITLFFLWYFGTELERMIGRLRMVWLLLGIWASLTVAAALTSLVLGPVSLAGIGLIEFAVLLLWIAEYPQRKFFFGIPAWVLGAVLVGLQALLMLAARDGGGLLSLALSLLLVAIVARRLGLLTEYAWIPGGRRPVRQKPARTQHRSQPPRADRRRASDRERLDALLDQINERGLDSLSPGQRRELMRLRDRLRNS